LPPWRRHRTGLGSRSCRLLHIRSGGSGRTRGDSRRAGVTCHLSMHNPPAHARDGNAGEELAPARWATSASRAQTFLAMSTIPSHAKRSRAMAFIYGISLQGCRCCISPAGEVVIKSFGYQIFPHGNAYLHAGGEGRQLVVVAWRMSRLRTGGRRGREATRIEVSRQSWMRTRVPCPLICARAIGSFSKPANAVDRVAKPTYSSPEMARQEIASLRAAASGQALWKATKKRH